MESIAIIVIGIIIVIAGLSFIGSIVDDGNWTKEYYRKQRAERDNTRYDL